MICELCMSKRSLKFALIPPICKYFLSADYYLAPQVITKYSFKLGVLLLAAGFLLLVDTGQATNDQWQEISCQLPEARSQ